MDELLYFICAAAVACILDGLGVVYYCCYYLVGMGDCGTRDLLVAELRRVREALALG